MKIGIIIYSSTGNTLFVAGKLKEELLSVGHYAEIEQVTAVDDKETKAERIRLKTAPKAGSYDALILGSPVRGGTLPPVMAAYLSGIEPLKGKRTVCFVTEFFPFSWMGGNQTIEQMKKVCSSKGADLTGTGIIQWSKRNRLARIDALAKELSKLF